MSPPRIWRSAWRSANRSYNGTGKGGDSWPAGDAVFLRSNQNRDEPTISGDENVTMIKFNIGTRARRAWSFRKRRTTMIATIAAVQCPRGTRKGGSSARDRATMMTTIGVIRARGRGMTMTTIIGRPPRTWRLVWRSRRPFGSLQAWMGKRQSRRERLVWRSGRPFGSVPARLGTGSRRQLPEPLVLTVR